MLFLCLSNSNENAATVATVTHKTQGRLLQEEVSAAVEAVRQRVVKFTLGQTPVREACDRAESL